MIFERVDSRPATWVGPVVGIGLIVAALAGFALMAKGGWNPAFWLLAAGLALAGVVVVASRFAGLTVALASVVCVVVGALALVHFGVASIRTDRTVDTRATATDVQAQLNTLVADTALSRATVVKLPSYLVAFHNAWLLCQAGGGVYHRWPDGTTVCVVPSKAPRTAPKYVTTARTRRATDPRTLALDRDIVQRDLDRFQLALLVAAKADPVRIKAAQAVVTAAQTTTEHDLAATLEPAPAISIASALEAGANAVVSTVPGSADVPVTLEALGWAVLGVLALLLIRFLSVQNATFALGPVVINPPKGGAGSDGDGAGGASDAADASADETESFRTYLLRNLPEPGSVPGGQAVMAMTDIAGLVAGPTFGPVASFVQGVVGAIKVPSGYAVEYCDITPLTASADPPDPPPPPAGDAPAADADATPATTAIAVRIRFASSNRLLDQKVFPGPDRPALLRRGAYWAAARIIEASRSVPPWARWDSATSATLADYYLAQDRGAGDDDLRILQQAALEAPTSGLLALQLSQEEALSELYFDAFGDALRAATLYPRYFNARYRVGVSANLLADHPEQVAAASPEAVAALRDALRRYAGSTRHANRASIDGVVGALERQEPISPPLLHMAVDELGDCQQLVRLRRVAANALRSDERRFWWQLLCQRRRRHDFATIGSACRLVAQARLWAPTAPELVAAAERHHEGLLDAWADTAPFAALNEDTSVPTRLSQTWQWAYDRACAWAVIRGTLGALADGDPAADPGRAPLADAAARACAHSVMARLDLKVVALLEDAMLSRYSFQLTRDWVQVDPDLSALHGNGGFERFVQQVPTKEDRNDARVAPAAAG
jgi:hypothetical protein